MGNLFLIGFFDVDFWAQKNRLSGRCVFY